MSAAPRPPRPWSFVPALYVLQGMPYWVVQTASNTFLVAMDHSPRLVGEWSSDLTLPWMLKPLWSPLVDLFGTKRGWLLAAAAAGLVASLVVAWATQRADYVEWTLRACLALAIVSATYDIAADGFYLLALEKRAQEAFVGIRNACYRLGRVIVTGGVVALAGVLQRPEGEHVLARALPRPEAWGVALAAGALVHGLLLGWNALALPRPAADRAVRRAGERAPLGAMLREYVAIPRFAAFLAFVLFYRCAESMLMPMIQPFLLYGEKRGGLALGEETVGWIYGTVGVGALVVGGIAGGWLVARLGLARVLWPMAIAMHAPNLLFAWAAHARPGQAAIAAVVGVEQLAYGFGFSAYMVVLLQASRRSRFATTHYALSTGLMALSGWQAGRWSGHLVEALGFERFFWLVSALGLVGLATLVALPRLEDRGAPAG